MASRQLVQMPTAALGAAIALVLGAGVVTSVVRPSAADQTLVLHHPVSASVIDAAGASHAGRNGETLAAGDSVSVAPGGIAEVTAGPRRLWLGSADVGETTEVRFDGLAAASVGSGSVVAVDPSGAGWVLSAGAVSESAIRGNVRIDRGDVVRLATYVGSATVSVAGGATLALGRFQDADAPGASLPGLASPLRLDDDGLDRIADAPLVTLDEGLQTLATQIDHDGYVEAAYKTSTTKIPSERVLTSAIALAGTSATLDQREQKAVSLRAAGASWGVVSEGLGTTLSAVQTALETLLAAVAHPSTTLVEQHSQQPDAPSEAVSRASELPSAAASRPASPIRTETQAAPSSAGVASSPSPVAPVPASVASELVAPPSPSASPTPTQGLLGTLLTTVGSLLPSAKPAAASPAPAATSAAASAPAATGLGGVIGGLAGR